MARHSIAARLLVACVALLLSMGQLFALGHLVLVKHVVCVEHGRTHHVDEERPAGPATPATVDPGANEGGPAPLADHDHCDGWVIVDELVVDVGVYVASAHRIDIEPPAQLDQADGTRVLDVLAVAPKLPPPSA
ncbi:MAG: hypothetical protein R3B13_39600 [Polyangiaceae bacterium]